MREAIVLGGSGAVGSVCVTALRSAGWEVRPEAAPRLETAARTVPALMAEIDRHSAEVGRLAERFAGADVVVMAAGLPTITAAASDALFAANALLPGIVCAAARQAGVRRVVHLSSVAVQGRRDPLDETLSHDVSSPYAAGRALGELLVDRLGDDRAIILRLPSVLGSGTSGQRVLARLARSPLCSTAGRGDRPRPVATAANVGAAVAFLAGHDGPVPRVVLQPGEGFTTGRLLHLLGDRRPVRIPMPVARTITAALLFAGRRVRRVNEVGRGLELMWLGQGQTASWLTGAGFVPVSSTAPDRLRIGVLTHWYKPERGPNPAPTATRLAEHGHDVKVLTGFPNYPTGKLYPGYRQRWAHREQDGDVAVRRVPLYASHDTNPFRRAANLLSFAATSTAAHRFLADRDVVYVYGSPMTAAAAAMVLRLRGVPYVLHVIDLWPDSVLESGMVGAGRVRRLVAALLGLAVRGVYRRAAHVVAVTPGIRQILLDRGVPADKVSVVYNWSEGELAHRAGRDPELRAELGRPGHTVAVFAGNVGQMQDVATIVRAAALCQDDTLLDVAIVGAGTAFAACQDLADELGAKNVRFFDRVDAAEMPRIYAASDYQLVTLIDRPLFHATIPSKLGDALAAGCPIITTVPGDVAGMCAEGGFGFSCAPEDPEALAEVFRLACAEGEVARSDKRRRARAFYLRSLSMRAALAGLESALAAAAGASP